MPVALTSPVPEEQILVDFVEGFARVWVKQRHGLAEELFLIVTGAGAAVCAVTQVGEMA
jgi:hypothetical protein